LLIPAGKLTEAMKAFEPALAISQKLADANPNSQEFQAQLAAAYRCFFLFHSSVENWGQAKKANQSALEILQKLTDANPTAVQFANDLATCYLNRALAISNTEASDETLRAYQAAVAINRKLVDADPSNAYHQDRLAFSMYAMGIVWMNLKNEAEATKLYESAQAIQEKVVADNPSITEFLRHLGLIYNNLAIMMGMKGETVEAMKKLQSAATVHEKLVVLNPSVAIHHLDLANDYLNLGGLQRMDGKPAEAIKSFESAQTICQKLSEDKPDFSESEVLWNKVLVEMVKADLAAKRNQEADERLRQAVDRHQRFFTVDPTNPTHRRYLADNLEMRITVCRILGDWLGLSELQSRLSELRRSDPENPVLDARLAAIIQGNQQPNRENDRVKLAKRADDQALYATAARLWGEVLEANPALKNDGLTQYPYRAARSAALAGCGAGKDHLSRDVSAQPKLRGQAREWLKANLATLEQTLNYDPTQVNPYVANTLEHWLQDANLAGIRDEDQLAKLPEAERKEWQSLWAEVEKLKKRAERPTH
jgi:tetratricopeptide (TPR) repeat protein